MADNYFSSNQNTEQTSGGKYPAGQGPPQGPSSNSGSTQQNFSQGQGSYKRNVAYKYRIGDLQIGKPITDQDTGKFNFLELGGKNIVRVNVAGNIVDKYESSGDKNYVFLTIDDGSGQMAVKAFGDDAEKYRNYQQGQTIVAIGRLRIFNDQLFINPEAVREQDPKYLLLRKKEIEKEKSENAPSSPDSGSEGAAGGQNEEKKAIKDKILEKIKEAEEQGGIETDQIIMDPDMQGTSPDIINEEVKKLLEEGIIFEPRPGKLRWLG